MDEGRPARRQRMGPIPSWLAWILWIAAAGFCAAGLRFYRVSNSMDAWMPDLAAPGPYRSYVVVGFARGAADPGAVAARLRSLPSVAFCMDPMMVRASRWLTGISADNLVMGPGGNYLGLFCFRNATATDRQLVEQVDHALAEFGSSTPFAVGGPAAFSTAMDQWSQARLPLILLCILLLGGGMLWLISFSLRLSIMSMAAITLSQVIFIGSVSWLGIPMDMSLSLVPPMMMGLGFSYAAHRALRRQSLGVLVVCGIAAAVGIASFATADLLPVRHFALAGVPGLAVVWLAGVTLTSPDPPARRRRLVWMRGPRRACVTLALGYPRLVIAAAVAISALGVAFAPRLRIQTDPLRFFPQSSRLARDFNTLDTRLTGMLPSQFIVEGDADPTAMLSATPGMRKVIDVTAWVGGAGRTFLCLANDDAVETLAAHWPDWQAWGAAHHVKVQWHGVAPQIHRSGVSIRHIALESLPSMAALIALLVGIIFRRIGLAFLGAWICLLPVAALVITAAACRWPLGPVTLMIGSITVGVAIDDTLHLLSASARHGSVRRGLLECWKPCVGSSLAAALCFATFLLSPFGPTAQFGTLMALATLYAMLANQMVLPACSALLSVRRHSAARRPSTGRRCAA